LPQLVARGLSLPLELTGMAEHPLLQLGPQCGNTLLELEVLGASGSDSRLHRVGLVGQLSLQLVSQRLDRRLKLACFIAARSNGRLNRVGLSGMRLFELGPHGDDHSLELADLRLRLMERIVSKLGLSVAVIRGQLFQRCGISRKGGLRGKTEL
jgi:hypothetical protein